MQKIIQIYQCLLKLWRKQESVTDGQTAAITISPHRYRGGIKKTKGQKMIDNILNRKLKIEQHEPH